MEKFDKLHQVQTMSNSIVDIGNGIKDGLVILAKVMTQRQPHQILSKLCIYQHQTICNVTFHHHRLTQNSIDILFFQVMLIA